MRKILIVFSQLVITIFVVVLVSLYYEYRLPTEEYPLSLIRIGGIKSYLLENSNEGKLDLNKIRGSDVIVSKGEDELIERRQKGHMDKILLRDLLSLTRFLNVPRSVCDRSVPQMVTLVQSACLNDQHRSAIRETWGKRASSLGIRVLFFVGRCPNCTEESEMYKDIVEVDFVDSFRNNTLKTLARLRWFLDYCPKARFLFMSDDDVVIHVENMLNYVQLTTNHTIVGYLYPMSDVVRDKTSKWYQPYFAYPYPKYPSYIGGPCYVVHGSAVRDVYEAGLDTTYISVDDVLFTGVAASMAEIMKIGDERFSSNQLPETLCGNQTLFCTGVSSPRDLQSLWFNKLLKCGY